jgi:hypothetical protein
MSTLSITIGIVAPVITFLIGRYFRSEKIKELIDGIEDVKAEFSDLARAKEIQEDCMTTLESYNEIQRQLNDSLSIQNEALLAQISNTATVQIVPNINPHHAADTDYVGIYPNNGLEPAHLTREEYQKGVNRLKDNPEDNILTKPVK